MANTFNPLRPRSFSSYIAELKQTMSVGAFRSSDGSRLNLCEKGKTNVVLAVFSKKIQSASDINENTTIAYFLNDVGEEVPVIYNPGEGKEAEFTL